MKKTFIFILLLLFVVLRNSIAQKQITHFRSEGEISSYPSNFVEFNGLIYYLATDAAHGRNIWVTDGTPEGTHFLLEAEPNQPKENKFVAIEIHSTLYFVTSQYVWKLSADNTATRLNDKPMDTSLNLTKVGDKLMVSYLEYVNLDNDHIEQISGTTQVFAATTPYISGNDYVAYYNYQGALYVITAQDNIIRKIATGYRYPTRLFNLKGKRYAFFSDKSFAEIDISTLSDISVVRADSLQLFHIIEEKNYIDFCFKSTNSLYKWRFDGETWQEVARKPQDNSQFGYFTSFVKYGLLIYAITNRYEDGKNYQNLVLFDSNNLNITTIAPTDLYIGSDIKKIQIINNKVYIRQLTSDVFRRNIKEVTHIFDLQTAKLITTPYAEIILFQHKNMLIGSIYELRNGLEDAELYRIEPSLALLKNVDDKLPNLSLGFFVNTNANAGFITFNEQNKGKVLYKFAPQNNQLSLIYQNPAELLYLNVAQLPATGYTVKEDYFVWGWGNEKQTWIYEYGKNGYSETRTYMVDNASNEVVNTTKFPWHWATTEPYYFEVRGKRFYQYHTQKPYEIDSTDIPLPTIFPTYGFDSYNSIVVDGTLFFMSNSQPPFANKLFAFSSAKGMMKISDIPIEEIHLWRGKIIAIYTNGDVYLIDPSHGNYDRYYVMTVAFPKDRTQFRLVAGWFDIFFVLYNESQLWYSDGHCKNSGLIYEGNNSNAFFGSFVPYNNGKSFLFSYGTKTFRFHNASVMDMDNGFIRLVGITQHYFYYVGTNLTTHTYSIDYGLFRMNIRTQKIEIVASINTPNNTNSDEMEGGIMDIPSVGSKILRLGNQLFLISPTETNETIVSINNKIDYVQPYYDNGKELLLGNFYSIFTFDGKDYKTIVPKDANTTIYSTIQSDKYFYFQVMKGTSIVAFYRISKTDYSSKKIALPYPIREWRTYLDVGLSYPVHLLGSKLYATIESPNEGMQLWEIDDADQQAMPTIVARTTTTPFQLQERCLTRNENQLVSIQQPDNTMVFPNPTNADLSIKMPNNLKGTEVRMVLYDITGNIIDEKIPFYEYPQLTDVYTIQLPSLLVGQYFLQLLGNNGESYLYRFVKY
jgi:ELWxxDGT repeat protein